MTLPNSKLITFNGKTQSLADHARDNGLKPTLVYYRRYEGMSLERALTLPKVKPTAFIRDAELRGSGVYSTGKIHSPCGTDNRYVNCGGCIACKANKNKRKRRENHAS